MPPFAHPSSLFSRLVNVTRFKKIAVHIVVWVAYYLYEYLFVVVAQQKFPKALGDIFQFSLYGLFVYVNTEWLFPRFFIPKRYGAYVLGVIGVFLIFLGVRSALTILILPWLQIESSQTYINLRVFFAIGIFRGIYFYVFGLVYSSVKYMLRTQQQLRAQERGLLEADIAFLKSQINPHFLFNALNFLYAQVYPLSEPTAKSVLLLSDIMRYALNEGGEQGKVMLDKELQYLRNYIALNQLRFGNTLQVQFEVSGSTQFLLILPLVLITFVENCFKHGELFDPAHPVLIQVRVQENQLTFFTSNRKRTGPVEFSTGIGLDNTRRRLQAIYPDRHQLTIHDTPDTYATHLNLTL
jgi:sensor histidine kinase YesM